MAGIADGIISIWFEALSASPSLSITLNVTDNSGSITYSEILMLSIVPQGTVMLQRDLDRSAPAVTVDYGIFIAQNLHFFDQVFPYEQQQLDAIGQTVVKRRNLSTTASIGVWEYVKVGGILASTYAKGFVDGIVAGAQADLEGAEEILKFIQNPPKAVKALREGLDVLLGMSRDELLALPGNMVEGFLSESEAGLPWQLEGDSDLQFYVAGFVTGYATEQIASALLVGGAVAKLGKAIRVAAEAGKLGNAAQKVAGFVTKLQKAKNASLRFLSQYVGDVTGIGKLKDAIHDLSTKFKIGLAQDPALEIIQRKIDDFEVDPLTAGKFNHGKISAKINQIAEDTGMPPARVAKFVDVRLGEIIYLLGDRATPEVLENFLDFYGRKMFVILPDGNIKDYCHDYIRAIHSKGAGPHYDILNILDLEDGATTLNLIESFFTNPHSGSAWHLGFHGSPSERAKWARGCLVELNARLHGKYSKENGWTYLDFLGEKKGVQEGLDFSRPRTEDGRDFTEFVQQTSTASANPDLIGKLTKSANAAFGKGGEGSLLTFDVFWLETNGQPDLTKLVNAAMDLEDDLGIDIEIIHTPVPFDF